MARPPVTITNPDKLYFPSGFRKIDMIRYYGSIASAMLPHLKNRPVTLIRFPNGVRGEKFYEKNAPRHAPGWIKTAPVPRQQHGGFINYILVNDVETLAWCANLGAIEFHPFLHRFPRLERPTHVAFDLDPGEGSDILTCVEVAHYLKELFDKLGLKSFPKVSGSKGIQLYVPLNTAVTYNATTPFAKSVAELLAKQHPKLVVSEMPKELRKKRVMIDWSQNVQAKTTVAVYSMRGKRDEPFISAPVAWSDLAKAARQKDADLLYFSPDETLKRVKKTGDLFAEVLTLKQTLPAAFLNLPPTKVFSFGKKRPAGIAQNVSGSLEKYAEKRDFSKTTEPSPDRPKRHSDQDSRRFVIQKHEASHLHFDLRLEMGGTLKSWAVPKGLPYELGVKRSAFQVEDHPIDYIDFEGTIPKGQYGGGTVMVWDIGTYEILGGNYYAGDLKLKLAGKKLKGEWHIFRIKSEQDKPVWLIAKAKDAMKPLSAKQEDTSVLSKRSMTQIEKANDRQWQSNRGLAQELRAENKIEVSTPAEPAAIRPTANRKSKREKTSIAAPQFVEPMKPQLVAALPEGAEWTYEVKWDGYRALLLKHNDQVQLFSRNEKSLAKDFPGVIAAGQKLTGGSFLIDGEIVALDAAGKPAFQELQNRGSTKAPIVFYAFDLLHLDGADLRQTPLKARREKLAPLMEGTVIRLSPALNGTADQISAAVQKLGLEGVVAKRRDSLYISGNRSISWQKMRLRKGQEFVIGGFRPGMTPFESVLVGYYEKGKLIFAGKVRPGFTPHSRAEVWDLIKNDEIDTCPFANLPNTDKKGRWGDGIAPSDMKVLRWVKPRVVVNIEFVEWTSHEHLRHAAFRGVRTDKKAKEVMREAVAE
ncbi:MAG: non-homologous end-joining DNA ligase [Lacunisphaera sp.]